MIMYSLIVDSFIIFSLLIIFLTHLIGAVAAFGSTLIALPLLVIIGWDIPAAVFLLLTIGSFQSFILVVKTFKFVSWRILFRMLLVATFGVPFGVFILSVFSDRIIELVLAVLLLFSGSSSLFNFRLRSALISSRYVLDFIAFLGGVVHGAMGVGGSLLTIYAHYSLTSRDEFRGTLTFSLFILNFFVIFSIYKAHNQFVISSFFVISFVFVILATIIGNFISFKLSQLHFKRFISVILIFSGLLTFFRSFL